MVIIDAKKLVQMMRDAGLLYDDDLIPILLKALFSNDETVQHDSMLLVGIDPVHLSNSEYINNFEKVTQERDKILSKYLSARIVDNIYNQLAGSVELIKLSSPLVAHLVVSEPHVELKYPYKRTI